MTNHLLANLIQTLTSERSHKPIRFDEFLDQIKTQGERIFRNIFQLFHDMIHFYISEVIDEYPGDTESIGFLKYNLDELFINDTEKPFFADRLFSNRLVNLAKSFRLSSAPNKIYVFKGPAGSGKSTFLNNLLDKFEKYVRHDDGLMYEVVWRIPYEEGWEVGPRRLDDIDGKSFLDAFGKEAKDGQHLHPEGVNFFEVPCPNHDNPFLLVPRQYRAELLRELVVDDGLRKRLFKHKQYQWVLKNEPCTVCNSIFDALTERFSIREIFAMIYARRYLFNRKQGIGISVFNSGDEVEKSHVRTNEKIQSFLNEFFQDSNKVKYVHSSYANTNVGVRALMDLKARNIQRFLDLHGIISDEVHKVQDIEERIRSLFIVLMNPDDFENVAKQSGQDSNELDTSMKDRLHEILVPYVLDYNTEIKIYTNTFGEQIKLRFMPHVLENFAKTIISSRIKGRSQAIEDWIEDDRAYTKVCDPDFYLLKMDLYTGVIPEWLTKEDRASLKAEVRKAVLAESEKDGHDGFSGRESLHIFNEFYTRYAKKRPITMRHLYEFFMDEHRHLSSKIPRDFLKHLTDLYDYEVLKEVKDSMYSFNDEEIRRTILNYLVAITHNVGDTFKNPYLNYEEFQVTSDFLDIVETHLMGYSASNYQRSKFRDETIAEYASVTLAREIKVEGKKIEETRQFLEMYAQFTKTARENVLDPYVGNSNFRCAIKEYETPDFDKYDTKIRERVKYLFETLAAKYHYTTDCAKVVVLYVIDNDLHRKFK
ncbi:MAG: putative serine protein kinase, PrkA [Candidatus Ozemobacter sibiricus]|uniref:Putative serine protein kinase, PrkA n=1 Tax=Candidatus Ozemobacter sibiricus TaxID=2268124 RepID=A0A367ZRY1_9BACT|nr:MAG: putative serine protein kinase, PrkA [Candidatus Ozemobacter sibiricus]